jgi:PAS domain S-box-containing protein
MMPQRSNLIAARDHDIPRPDFAFLVDNATDFIAVCDVEFRPVYVNSAALSLVGLAREDLSKISVFDFFAPEEQARIADEFFPMVLRDGHGTVETTFRHFQTGARIPMLYKVVRMHDVDGNLTGYATISQDLSERRRTEDALRSMADEKALSLARFRELADAMPQIVWSSDASGRVDYLNRRWYELTGRALGDPNPHGVVHPEDRERAESAFRRSLETGIPYEEEFRLCLPGASEPRWYLGRALPVRGADGRIARWYATSTDIHDRKQTEAELADSRERLRAALDASVTGTFRWNIDSGELDWDDNLDRLFGLAPGTTARSLLEFIRLVHSDDRQRVIDACARCAAGAAEFNEEFRVAWPDGTVRWLSDKGRVYDGRNGTRYMAGACVDVTDRRVKEDALRAADRQKDEFLGMLAHEIRNPLAPMMYSASILEQRIEDPELKRPIEVISRQARRMIRIVDDLLDVSRVTQGKISLQRERLRVADLVAHCTDACRPFMQARRHRLDVGSIDPALLVHGDIVRLSQVIENILINAAKYTPDHGRIGVTATAQGSWVAIEVTDTGVGISPAMLTRVFELFAQADTSLDRAEGGLGIGLTLVDKLVRMHGGHVEARSPGLGLGSTFTVRLPLMRSEELSPQKEVTPMAAISRTVLVVDDNVDSAEMLKALLEMNGHTVQSAHDGRTAISLASASSCDVILLDIGLPGMDGYQVVQQLRAMPSLGGVTIVATTGYGREEDRARCLAAGFDDHLTKPIDHEQLERILEKAKSEREKAERKR